MSGWGRTAFLMFIRMHGLHPSSCTTKRKEEYSVASFQAHCPAELLESFPRSILKGTWGDILPFWGITTEVFHMHSMKHEFQGKFVCRMRSLVPEEYPKLTWIIAPYYLPCLWEDHYEPLDYELQTLIIIAPCVIMTMLFYTILPQLGKALSYLRGCKEVTTKNGCSLHGSAFSGNF